MDSFLAAPALPRIPLVPQSLLKAHGVDCIVDTRFRAAARLLQRIWLLDNGIATGVHVRKQDDGDVITPLESLLSREAAHAGRNFLSPEIHTFVRRELIMREEGAYYEEDRLFGNALSSAPMTFNIFAPLAMDTALASTVFRDLLPDFVKEVQSIRFETSPGRREPRFLNDGTAFDLALDVTTPDNDEATVFIEVKYSETMDGPAARYRPRYDEASREVQLFIDPDAAALRSLALEQLFRELSLAQLAVNEGITQRAMFIAIGPRLNRRAQAAFRCFANELIPEEDLGDDRVRFRAITLETVVDAIRQAGAVDHATKLWARYCDFERVFHLAMAEYTQNQKEDPSTTIPQATRSSAKKLRDRRQQLENRNA